MTYETIEHVIKLKTVIFKRKKLNSSFIFIAKGVGKWFCKQVRVNLKKKLKNDTIQILIIGSIQFKISN